MTTMIHADIETRHPGRVLHPMPKGVRRPLQLPLYVWAVRAGFPSPADDYIEGLIDLNQYLVHDEPGTFMVRVAGDSMRDAAILPGDILVVDRSLAPADGNIVVAEIDGEFTVKELRREFGRIALFAHNPAYPPILLREGQELVIFGVVTGLLRKLPGLRR
jgi:DNA polymerase V